MGYGPGYWRKKHPTTSDFPSLDIRSLQRAGYLTPGHSHTIQLICENTESITAKTESDNKLIITYRHGNNKANNVTYKFRFEWMSCHLGGKRAFFLCPQCGRRVCLTYCVEHWGCRHCHDLSYACQGENAEDRHARQANKIRGKLGWKQGILNPMGDKPKGMHGETFEHLAFKQMWYASKVLDSMSRVFRRAIYPSSGTNKAMAPVEAIDRSQDS